MSWYYLVSGKEVKLNRVMAKRMRTDENQPYVIKLSIDLVWLIEEGPGLWPYISKLIFLVH